MSSFWNFAFGFILVILWIVSGVFITQASIYLTPYKDTDEYLHRAYWFTFWGAFVTWFLVALFIILVILSIVGLVALFGSGVGEAGVAAEGVEGEASLSQLQGYAQSPEGQSAISGGISWLTLAFLIFALILVTITGVLAAIAASSMAESPHFDRSVAKLNTAYTDCIVAASVCLGAAGILLIGTIIYFIIGWRAEQARKKEFEEIQELRRRTIRQRLLESAQQRQLAQFQQQELRQQLLQQTAINPVPINVVDSSPNVSPISTPPTTPASTSVPTAVIPVANSGVSVSVPISSAISRYLS